MCLAGTAAAILLLALGAPAVADPGSPGLSRPTTAVYEEADERPVLGDNVAGTQGGGNGGEEAGAFGGSADSLPFTGFSAALVLGGGLAALLMGLALRGGTGRLRQT